MANVNPAWAASSAVTLTFASLASDTSLLAGRQSDLIDFSSFADYTDVLVSGQVTTGTTPTAGRKINIYAWSWLNDTPTYPDSFSTADANRSITSLNVGFSFLKLIASITVDSTSNRAYPFGQISMANLFGGVMPKKGGLWVVQNTAAALNSTSGNHFAHLQGVSPTF